MMAFNLFNTAQLPAGLPPGTPMKAEDSNAEALRFLASGAGLLGAAGPMPLPPMPMEGLRAMLPAGLQFPLVYPGLQEFKPELFSAGGGPMPPFFDGLVGFHPYAGLDGSRRKNATRETTAPLKEWLIQHRTNPYPTKGEKVMLAVMTKMTLTQRWLEEHNSNPYPTKGEKLRLAYTANLTLTQVSTWFANARRRLKKENGGSVSIKRRPEDGDDDDDMAELDRPSSSNSTGSDIKEEVDIDAAETENAKAGSTTPSEQMTPKKKSILSIDDILNNSKKDDEAGSSKKDSPSSEESAPSWGFNLSQMQQFMALCRSNPQMMAAMGPRFLPFNPLMMMGPVPTTPTGPPLNGSFTSETTSVSPSSSHSPSAPADEPKSPKTEA